jgi:two-component system response regulator NreC
MPSPKRKIRVLIADDHAVLRAGLRLLLRAQGDLEVVAEASDAKEATVLARKFLPDVIVMDVAMPDGGPTSVSRALRASPASRVLVLTMYDDPAYARAMLGAGAHGYVVKKAADSELISAIRAIHKGRSFVDVRVSEGADVRRDRKAWSRMGPHSDRKSSELSPRESEVLELLARGFTNRQIGEQIGVGVKTVETYRSRLSEKLGLLSRADIVAYAIEKGLLKRSKRQGRY